MRRIAALAAVAATWTLLGGNAGADLKRGRTKFLQGDYKAAITELAKTNGKDKAAAQLLLAQTHARVGDHAAAETIARTLAASKDASLAADGTVLLAEILRATGRYADALKVLEPMAAANPTHLATQAQLALVYRELGQSKKARAIWESSFMHPIDADSYDTTTADKLYYLAQAARHYGELDLANDAYREAVSLDVSLLQANIEWGQLFLDKYAAADAETSFDEVLKLDPHHPDAHAGMARVKLEQSYDLKAANHHIAEALAVNPRHVPSLLVRAGMEIDQNQWTAARATLAEALKVNPMNFEGRALLATIYWLRDDTAAYQAEKQRVLAANPEYAELFHIIARSAVREHRYKEAIDLEKEAVAINPEYYEAMQAIGTGYLRLGDDKEGVKWLEKSWKGDSYNVRTKNTLDLFDEVIPKSYGFTTTKYFKYRYHNDEQKILHRYIAPVLDRAFEDMVKRYGFKPQTPVSIELFQEAEHYSVRTVGLPNLGALGVCFGQVITALSPSVGDINWSMVLWHELAHVFAIQMSKSRVPRWFTEGLSEYETIIARPEWRRENDADIWAAMEDGTLPSVAELNYGFMKPSMQEVVVAYHLSSVTIEYIAKTYGFPKIVQALKLFAQGHETPEVIKRITGLGVPAFDLNFRKYLETRLAAYKGTFRPPTAGMDDVKQLEIDDAAKPKDADTQARLAFGHYLDANAPAAQAAATTALAL
ncbi:MAG TPA: tetratricopeptide repeat protein, partial [Kofleriaceae bacterium]|nr:tetratricopeptide repeat protein [Kofleriaceae bacterium]